MAIVPSGAAARPATIGWRLRFGAKEYRGFCPPFHDGEVGHAVLGDRGRSRHISLSGKVKPAQPRTHLQRIRAKHIQQELHQLATNLLQLPGKLIAQRLLPRILFAGEKHHALIGQGHVEPIEVSSQALAFAVGIDIGRFVLGAHEWKSDPQQSPSLRIAQVSKELRETGQRVALAEYDIDWEILAKNPAYSLQAFIKCARECADALGIGRPYEQVGVRNYNHSPKIWLRPLLTKQYLPPPGHSFLRREDT